MSIEDPRLSSIDNTSAADDFDSAVEQHLGFNGEAADGIEVAQAETPEAGRTDRLPAQTPPVQTASATIPTEVTPNGDNVVTLPAGIELDNLEFQVDGENLILVLADGTEIVVIGGAANIPTFVIGEVELPQVALFAALEGSNINIAAGPDGTFSAQGTPDGNRNFEDDQIGDDVEQFELASLLGDTDQGSGQDAGVEPGAGSGPSAGDLGSFGFDEAVLVTEGTDDDIFRGVLTFRQGAAFGTITGINLIGVGGEDLAGNVLEPTDEAAPYPLTSGGHPVAIVTQTVDAESTATSFLAVQGTKTVLVDGVEQTKVVFTLTVTDRVNGRFEFRLFEPLDHADLDEADADDLLRLAFNFAVTDFNGEQATGFFDIDVADDEATISVPTTDVDGVPQPTVGVVEEEQLNGGNDEVGNPDVDGGLDADVNGSDTRSPEQRSSGNFQDKTTQVATGGLGISWGADNLDASDELDGVTPAGLGNRTVSFVKLQPDELQSSGESDGGGDDGNEEARLTTTGLTSNGFAIVYVYSEDGKTLTAYRVMVSGETLTYVDDSGKMSSEPTDDARVFEVVLDDNGSGTYTFTLLGTIDHNGANEDAVQLNFKFTATDSDGDTTAPATFGVKVIDDVAKIGTPFAGGIVEEEQREVAGIGNEGTQGEGDADSWSGPFWNPRFIDRTTHETGGTLAISWGSDDANGENGQLGNRSVQFAPNTITSLEALNLTSDSVLVKYTIIVSESGQETLLAYTGVEPETVPQSERAAVDAGVVFRVDLSDLESGSYAFKLYNSLEQPETEQGEDSLNLDFQFTATDSDGDVTEPATFTVKIIDDVLEIGRPESETVDEDGRPGLESGAGNPGPSGHHSGDSDGDTSERGDLNIRWGADDGNRSVNGGFTDQKSDRAVIFAANSVPEGLTSNGFGIVYIYNATRTELVAYRVDEDGYLIDSDGKFISRSDDEATYSRSDDGGVEKLVRVVGGELSSEDALLAGDAVVFEVKLSDTDSGSYGFTLRDNLDHDDVGEDNIDLRFNFTARDGDGDLDSASFTVVVDDDTPVFYRSTEDETVFERSIGETDAVQSGNLYVSWGADNANSDVNGGATNLDGDRYVVFRTQSAPANLTSNGFGLSYVYNAEGTALVAYRVNWVGQLVDAEGKLIRVGEVPVAIINGALSANAGELAGDAAVFSVTLSDQGTGSYTFTLIDNLDHVGRNRGEEIDLEFQFKAVDSDGDVLNGSFEVDVRDAGPSLGGNVSSATVDEEGVEARDGNGGESYPENENIVAAADADGAAYSTGEVALNINWGNDADLKSERLGNGQIDDPVGRQVVFASLRNGSALGTGEVTDVTGTLGAEFASLKSGTQSLTYRIDYLIDPENPGVWNGGYVLTASVGESVVFKVTLDPTDATGTYKFDLLGVLDHRSTNAEDDIELTFRFKPVDSDGDTTRDAGTFKVTIDDDAPIAGVVVSGQPLLHDETRLVQDGTDDKALSDLPTVFQNPNLGTVIGWAQQIGMVSTDTSSYGADGAGSTTLALTQANGSAFNGFNSGLQNLAGNNIQLFSEGGLVLGKVGNIVYFALQIENNGTVNIAQYQPIKHADAANPNDLDSIDDVFVTVTVTDRDGDVKSATTSSALDLKIVDDGPSVNPIQTGKTVDEDGLSTGNGAQVAYLGDATETDRSVSGNLAYSFGTDGKSGATDDIVFNTSSLNALNLESLGTSLSYSWNNDSNTLTAKAGQYGPTVFTLEVTNVNTGAFTFTLNRPLDHDTRNIEDDINIDFGFTIKDADGDTASGSIRITIDDDAPFIGTPESERVSEASLPYTWNDELNPNGGNSAYQTGDLAISWGADNQDNVWNSANRSVAFAAGLAAPTGLSSDGEQIRYEINSDGTELTAVTGSGFGKEVIFTVKLNDDGSGTYEFKLFGNVDHAPNTSEKLLSFGFVAKDSDGDTASSSFNVTIEDQTASLGTVETKTVDEEFLSGSGNTGTEHTYPGDVSFNFTRVEADLNINWGADDNNSGSTNNRSVRFDGYANGANFGSVKSDGAQVKVWVGQDGTLYGYVGSDPSGNNVPAVSARVFTVSLDDDGSGSYTFNLLGNLDHSATRLEDNLELNFNFKVTDSDGDVTTGGNFKVIVNDDAARLTRAENSTVDEDGTGLGNAQLPGANNSQATGDANGAPLRVTGKSLGIEWGADNNTKSETLTGGAIGNEDDPIGRTVAFADASANTPAGTALAVGTVTAAQLGLGALSSGGVPLVYTISYLQSQSGVWNGGYVLTAKGAGGIEIFKVTLDPEASNGAYSFELKGPLDHTFGDNIEGDLNLNFKFAAFDADGDPASGINFSSPISNGTFTVTVNDDSATARNDNSTVAEDTVPASGNLISNDTVGADGATVHQVKLPGSSSFVEVTTGTVVQGGGYSFEVAGKGTYVFKPNGEWSFTPLANFNGNANFEYKLRDGDGDVSNAATVTVRVTSVNDAPIGNDDTFTVTEDQISAATSGLPRTIGNVLANDTDIDNAPVLNPVPNTQTLSVQQINSVTINNGTNTGVALTLDPTPVNGVYKISGTHGDAYLKVEANGEIKMWTDSGEDPYKALGTTESATITIGYTVKDSVNPALTDTATAVITINGSNDNPDAVNDSFLGGIGGTFSDNFNDGNANGWTAVKLGTDPNKNSGQWTVINGAVTEKQNNADAFLKAPVSGLPSGAASSTVYRIEVDADPQNRAEPIVNPEPRNEAVGLVFGFVDNKNFYRAYWKSYDENSEDDADYRDLVLEKVVNGVVTNLSTVNNVNFGNDMMKFVLSVGADGIHVEVTGNGLTKELTSTDRPALGGYGLYSEDNDDGVTYDNFSITVGGAITTAEDTALTIQAADLLANDSDVDGDAISVFSVSATSANGGLVSLVNGVITYTPALNFNGQDTFTYTISDGKGGTDTATVTINVTPVNDAPVAADDTYSTEEDTPLHVPFNNGVLVNDMDVDGDAINAMLVTNPAHGTLSLSFTGAGTFVYTPDANYNGPDSFTYKVYDANAEFSNIATVTINVTAVNDAPTVENAIADQSILEEGTVNFTVPANTLSDVDSAALSYTATLHNGDPLPTWLTFDPVTRTFSGTSPLNENGAFEVKVTAFDGEFSVSDTFTLTVTPVNDAATTNDSTGSGNEDTLIEITLSGDDVDGTVAGYVIKSVPTDGVLYSDAGMTQRLWVGSETLGSSVFFKPYLNFNGEATFTYAAKDDQNAVDDSPATVTITVAPVNDNPGANNDVLHFGGDTAPAGTGWVLNSQNGHYYKFVSASGVSWSDAAAGAANQAQGAYLLTLTNAAEQSFVLNNVGVSGQMLWLGASDAQTEDTFKWVTGPEAGSVIASYLPWAPGEPNNWGGDEDYIAINRFSGPNYQTPLWNDAGSISNDTSGYVAEWSGNNGAISEDTVQTFSASLLTSNDGDVDGDSVAVTGLGDNNALTITTANGATVTLNTVTGQISYDPTGSTTIQGLAQGATLADTFKYWISDGNGGVASATASITINGVNDVPTITGLTSSTVSEDGTLVTSGTLTIVDPDSGQSGATAASGSATYGTWSINAAGAWTYTLDNTKPAVQALNSGQFVDDYFTVTTADGTPQVISIRINGLNEPGAPLTVVDTTSATNRYAFSDDNVAINTINFNAATLFAGGTGTVGYSYQLVYSTNSSGWSGSTGNVFNDNPESFEEGVYIYRATATDSAMTVSTYFALSVIQDAGMVLQVLSDNNGNATGAAGWVSGQSGGGWGDLIVGNVPNPNHEANANTGNDVMLGQGGVNRFDGDGGDDTLYGFAGNDILEGGSGNDFVDGGADNDTITGGTGNDVLVGGSGHDTFNYVIGDGSDIVDGGSGTGDTLAITGSGSGDTLDVVLAGGQITQFNGGTVANVENVTANLGGGSDTLSYAGTAQDVVVNLTTGNATGFSSIAGIEKVTGGSGNDTLTGNSSANTLIGGAGLDTLRGGSGGDVFKWGSEGLPSTPDIISDYTYADSGSSSDKIDLNSLVSSFAVLNAIQYVRILNSNGDLLVQVDTNGNASGGAGWTTVYSLTGVNRADQTDSVRISIGGHTFKIEVAPNGGLHYQAVSDPIILDLDHNGFAFSSIDTGVTFDINADGKSDQIAWTSDDGILAFDVDGNGVIDNGSEIFTPDFNGGKFASGVAALASLDGNGDGKIDGSDTAFDELKVWIDANNNGISDEGELSSLSDHDVASISLTTDQTGGEEDGQTIFAEGEFTFEDGSTGNFVEVGFETIFGSEPEGLTLHGGMGEVVMTGSAGADTFVFDGTALDDLDVADVITDFSSEEGDVLDVTALLDSLLGEATVETHLRATVDDGNTTVSVQTDANVWKDVVVLQDHTTAIKVLFDDQHATITPPHND